MLVVAPLSRICGLLSPSFSSTTSCTIVSPLMIVMRTVSPGRAHSVGLRTPSISPPDAAIPQHRRVQDVFTIDGRLSGLADKVGAHAGEEKGRHMGGDTGATHDVSGEYEDTSYVLVSCAPCAWIFRIAAAM